MAVGARCRLVLHADDFGMSQAVNRGILKGFRDGLLTSTSLLANAPAADAACRDWKLLTHEQRSSGPASNRNRRDVDDSQTPFDLGVHLNLTQGRPLTGERFPNELLDHDGNFPGIARLFYRLQFVGQSILDRVTAELQAQIEWLNSRELRPTHLNGHQYVELIPAIARMIPELVRRYSIPVVRVADEPGLVRNVLQKGRFAAYGLALVKRHYAKQFRLRMTTTSASFPDCFFGTSHAGRIGPSAFLDFLREPLNAAVVEIGMHPGDTPQSGDINIDPAWNDPLARYRPAELDWLCRPELVELLKHRGITLTRLTSLGARSLNAVG